MTMEELWQEEDYYYRTKADESFNCIKDQCGDNTFKAIKAWVQNECTYAYCIGFVEKAKGDKQDSEFSFCEFEYVDQSVGCCCDDYYGHIYLPIKDKYIKIYYQM